MPIGEGRLLLCVRSRTSEQGVMLTLEHRTAYARRHKTALCNGTCRLIVILVLVVTLGWLVFT